MGPVGQVQRDGLCGADHATSQNLGAGAGPATRFERVGYETSHNRNYRRDRFRGGVVWGVGVGGKDGRITNERVTSQ